MKATALALVFACGTASAAPTYLKCTFKVPSGAVESKSLVLDEANGKVSVTDGSNVLTARATFTQALVLFQITPIADLPELIEYYQLNRSTGEFKSWITKDRTSVGKCAAAAPVQRKF